MKVFGQLEKALLENLTADPTGTGLVAGRMWYRTDTQRYKVYDGSAVQEFVDLASAQTLQAKVLSGANISDYMDLDHVASPADPSAGKLRLFAKSDNTLYVRDSSGIETPVGSGTGGVKNFFEDGDFERDIGLASVYDNVGAYVDGTGGSPVALSIAQNSTSPLAGTYDLKISKSAADASGEGVTLTTDTIDNVYRGRKLYFEFEWGGSAANYTDGDFALKCYALGDAAILPVYVLAGANEDGTLPNRATKVVGYIQTTTSTTSLRLSLHLESDSATTSAFDCFLDECKIGPDSIVPGYIGSNYENRTDITLDGTGSTPTTQSCIIRRDGPDLILFGYFTTSGAGSGASFVSITLPDSLEFRTDMANLVVGTVGTYNVKVSAQNDEALSVICIGTNTLHIMEPGTGSRLIGSDIIGAAQFRYEVRVPIEGWSASAALSTTEVNLQTVDVRGEGNGGTSITANTTNLDFTEVSDRWNVWNGSQFTAPYSGKYSFKGAINTTASVTGGIYLYIDGTQDRAIGDIVSATVGYFSGETYLNQGEVASIRISTAATLSNSAAVHHLSITQIPDLTHFSVYGEKEIVETVYASDYSQATPTVSTWYVPNTAFKIDLSPGSWNLRLSGFMQMQFSTSAFGNQTVTDVQLGTSTTPGSGLIGEYKALHTVVHNTGGLNKISDFELQVKDFTTAVPVSIYVHMRYRGFSGTPTVSSMQLRSAGSSGQDSILTAERIS